MKGTVCVCVCVRGTCWLMAGWCVMADWAGRGFKLRAMETPPLLFLSLTLNPYIPHHDVPVTTHRAFCSLQDTGGQTPRTREKGLTRMLSLERRILIPSA